MLETTILTLGSLLSFSCFGIARLLGLACGWMPTRLIDIARSLDLSVATVSGAIKGRSDISKTTRERVLRKVSELNYRPNSLARSLVTRRTHLLGIIVPDLSRAFFSEALTAIERVTSAAGFTLLLCNTQEDSQCEERVLSKLLSQRVDGLIIASAQSPPSNSIWRNLAHNGTPFVLMDRRFPRTHFVGGDDKLMGYLATAHLFEQGYRRIAHIGGPRTVATAIGRKAGYLKAVKRFGLEILPQYLTEVYYHEESSAIEAMQSLLKLATPPDAIVAASDPIAIGAIEAALQAGLKVPEEFGIIGVGNHRYGQYLKVPLSTIDQRRTDVGEQAAKLLLDLINASKVSSAKVFLIKPELIIRASSCRFSLPAQS